MVLIVDDTHLGTSETHWNAGLSKVRVKDFEPLRARRVVVIAPHPDDEVLGAGGLIERALRERIVVEVVAVTDGEASHPASQADTVAELAKIRVQETRVALQRLGWTEPEVTYLHLPDGHVAERRKELDDALESFLLPDDLCVAPWIRDGHPDHDATGEAALRASSRVGARSLGYMIWAWHWAEPEGDDIPWSRCFRLNLSRRTQARKRWSTGAFASQTHRLGPDGADAPILPAPVLRRFWRPFEMFVDESGSPG